MKRQKGKKKGQPKERVFGCDLITHLETSGHEVPQVLKSCTEFIEEHGIVDGIYRLSGISSNIQKLRQEFDTEKTADLSKELYLQDIHCVSSLCKAYFRELPNPLLMYQLYDKFADAVNTQLEEDRLLKIRNVLQDLPCGHYRTLEYLMRHLLLMASFSSETNMHARNLAIVWAPNLLRSKDIESSGFNGTAAFMEVRVQSIVVEFILNHVEQLFGRKDHNSDPGFQDRRKSLPSPSSAPNLRFDEVPLRSLASQMPHVLNMGDGPPAIRPYHSIIELPDHRRKGSLKVKKWRSIFNLGRSGTDSKRKVLRNEGKDVKSETRNLRPAKSMDSLSSVPFTNDDSSPGSPHRVPSHAPVGRRDSFGSRHRHSPAPEPHPFSSLGPEILLDTGAGFEPAPILRPGADSPRSGKAARLRAEKRAAMHISGPFSVSLPDHVSTLLHKAPGPGSEWVGGRAEPGERGSAAEEEEEAPKELVAVAAEEEQEEEEEEAPKELVVVAAEEEQEEEGTTDHHDIAPHLVLSPEISLELQDTFSFLDSQDTSETGDCDSDYPGELGLPLRMPEEMELFGYAPHCDRDRVEMSIECELMEHDIDSRELNSYDEQEHCEEFSVEPPLDEVWNQVEIYEPPSETLGFHSGCPTDAPPSVEGVGSPEEDSCPLDPRTPTPAESLDGSAEFGNEGFSNLAVIDGQEDPIEGCTEAGDTGCSTIAGVAGWDEPSQGSVDVANEGCSTLAGFAEQEEEPALPPGYPEVAREPPPAPMRLESSLVRVHHAKALPVVPPKPHYAKLPPALKSKRRPEPPEPQAVVEEASRPSPASRWTAWRSSGSMSFDEAVARAKERKNAPLHRLQTFSRGDSFPIPSPALSSAPRDRLSLPRFPDPLRSPTAELVRNCQPRCRSLVLEGEESE